MATLIELFGRCHPALVHLPIGFLLIALVFQWLSSKEKYRSLAMGARIAYLLGMAAAILSCVSGWILSAGGEYDETTLNLHRWAGIAVALCSLIGYLFSARPGSAIKTVMAVVLLVLVFITGHLGGTLTHGDGFLTKGIGTAKKGGALAIHKPIANIGEAQVYGDIVQPILLDKCGGCHGPLKQKGGLRIDGKEWILKGGKDGPVWVNGNAAQSELYKRVVLDPLEEKHMPPKGKPQMTEQEANLLQWWITSNAGFDKKVKEVPASPQITQTLITLQSLPAAAKRPGVPPEPVDAARPAILDSLRRAGIGVVEVAAGNHYLSASFVSIPKPGEKQVALLSLISKQLVWLQIGHTELTDESWKRMGGCTQLTQLRIDHSNMNDARLVYLSGLLHLQSLNLVGTKVTAAGLVQLKQLHELAHLYLGQTGLDKNGFASVQKNFPGVMIDSGNYSVEFLRSDTELLKAPALKK